MNTTLDAPTFYLRCDVCQREIHVEWGPETHSQARRGLIEHIEKEHSDAEIRDWAMRRLVFVAWTEGDT